MREKNPSIAFLVSRQECLADDQTDRWIAVVGCDGEKPAFDRVQFLRWNPVRHTGIVNAEEDDPSLGIREPDQLSGELFDVSGNFALVVEAQGHELGLALFSGSELVQDPLPGVEHRFALPVALPAAHTETTGLSLFPWSTDGRANPEVRSTGFAILLVVPSNRCSKRTMWKTHATDSRARARPRRWIHRDESRNRHHDPR